MYVSENRSQLPLICVYVAFLLCFTLRFRGLGFRIYVVSLFAPTSEIQAVGGASGSVSGSGAWGMYYRDLSNLRKVFWEVVYYIMLQYKNRQPQNSSGNSSGFRALYCSLRDFAVSGFLPRTYGAEVYWSAASLKGFGKVF